MRAERRAGDALSRHRFCALVEPLAAEASFVSRAMFGCVGCYRSGRLVLVLADRGEPWQGLLLPTEHRQHASLLEEFRSLRVHPLLGKWLYLAQSHDGFADAAAQILERIGCGDPRFGVETSPPLLPRREAARPATVADRRRRP